jgi:hypothetical protein
MTLLARIIVAVGLAGVAFGCATASDDLRHGWAKPGATADDLARDRYNCIPEMRAADTGPLASASVGARVTPHADGLR